MKRALCWIRRDLRLHDHVALREATREADEVAIVFVFDDQILNNLADKDDKRITFIMESLKEVQEDLKNRGSRLIVRYGDPIKEIPWVAKKFKAEAVFTNRDYEPYAKKRDQAVSKELAKTQIGLFQFKDHVIFEGREILTGQGEPYKVFTPYKNAWLDALKEEHSKNHQPNLKKLVSVRSVSDLDQGLVYEKAGFTKADLWLKPGSQAGKRRLQKFQDQARNYQEDRNFPAKENGTSGLSAHFRFGTLSIREAVRFAKADRSQGARVWLSELVWRDFYQMILDQFPRVATGSFKEEYNSIRWPGKEEHLQVWKEGRTGFPIVDAAMRHFAQTGWMHNRLRMIVASFLTKDLLIDWREGEKWFARKLLDFDLAANNGGWQWSASTGCDAQPYFRIFNPVSQSEKFDPKGEFIRRHLPELKNVSDKDIHFPGAADLFSGKTSYPDPIVDHKVQRIKALEMFKKAKRNA